MYARKQAKQADRSQLHPAYGVTNGNRESNRSQTKNAVDYRGSTKFGTFPTASCYFRESQGTQDAIKEHKGAPEETASKSIRTSIGCGSAIVGYECLAVTAAEIGRGVGDACM